MTDRTLPDLTDEKALSLVQAELRTGGEPIRVYCEVKMLRRPNNDPELTTAIMRSFEQRICAIETELEL